MEKAKNQLSAGGLHRVGAAPEEVHAVAVAAVRCEHQGRRSVLLGLRRVGAVLEELVHAVAVAALRCEHQGRDTSSIGHILWGGGAMFF